jgi:multimeric flavodoxin WrbA
VAQRRVLGIMGSPRRGGNTETLMDEVLRAARDAGATTEKAILKELRIGPCQACDGCQGSGICVQHDDMPALIEKMVASQVWVLGTPIYWWGPTAQFKLFMDRWYAPANGPNRSAFQGKQVVVTIPMGDSDPATARHTVGMIQDALNWVEANLVDTVLAPGVNALGEVKKHPELMAAAFSAGSKIGS